MDLSAIGSLSLKRKQHLNNTYALWPSTEKRRELSSSSLNRDSLHRRPDLITTF